jgi:hypothetical protein
MNLSVPFNWNFLRSTAILFEKIDGLPTTIDEPLATFSSLSAVVERIGDYAQLRKPAARGTRKHALDDCQTCFVIFERPPQHSAA